MNDIQKLYAKLSGHSRLDLSIEPPAVPAGVWTLDVRTDQKHLIVEWREAVGFGLSSAEADAFGELPDEHLNTVDEAARRIEQLIVGDERTSPPLRVLLSRLREERGLTQKDLAQRLGLKQASVSGMERRGDIQLSTLWKVIAALGGRLELYANFADATYRIDSGLGYFQPNLEVRLVAIGRELTDQPNYDNFPCLKDSGALAAALKSEGATKMRRAAFEMV